MIRLLRSGSVYGRHSLDASATGIDSWLHMGHYSTAGHLRITFVSANKILLQLSVKRFLYRFVAINGVGVYLYVILYQAQDEEEYGGAWEVLKEGMLSSSAFFVVSVYIWYIQYMKEHRSFRSTGFYGTQHVTMDNEFI